MGVVSSRAGARRESRGPRPIDATTTFSGAGSVGLLKELACAKKALDPLEKFVYRGRRKWRWMNLCCGKPVGPGIGLLSFNSKPTAPR